VERRTVLGRLTWQLAEVVEVVSETPRVRSIALRAPAWPGHRAGQHIDLRLTAEDGYQAQRSYSIASAPEDAHVAITVEKIVDGEVSPYLVDELRPGDHLEIRGPIGGYFTWAAADGGPLLLLAGGSGVVPLMAMLRHRAVVRYAGPTTLLYSSRSAEDIIYRAELERLAAADRSLRIVHTLTRSQPQGWTGYHRRIDHALLAEVAPPSTARPLAFVCGPTRMVENAAEILTALGYAAARIKTERFGPTGGSDGSG
jgi:ferredoxin-NADP reductase